MALEVKKRYPVPRTTRSHYKLPQQTYKREQRRRSLHRLTSFALVLLIFTISGGVGYTWYMGKQKVAVTEQALPSPIKRPVLKPLKVASNAPIGIATQMLTSPVKAGDNASITIKTNPVADCTISVAYNNVPAHDSGLAAKPADEFGIASWAWTVAAGTPPGKWPVEVTCKNKKYNAVVIGDMVVNP